MVLRACCGRSGGAGWGVRGQYWHQDAVVDLGVDHRDPDSVRGEQVSVAVREAFDEALERSPDYSGPAFGVPVGRTTRS